MANIVLADSPTPQVFPFDMRPFGSGDILPMTAYPRARIIFRTAALTIVAKIATNTTSINSTCILPSDYGYVLEYAYQSVELPTDLDDADHFADNGAIRFQLGDGQSSRTNQSKSAGLTALGLNAGSQKIWCPDCTYPLPLFNVAGNVVTVVFDIWDTDIVNATIEGDYFLLASFLQYDLEQIYKLGVNFPQPVQVR